MQAALRRLIPALALMLLCLAVMSAAPEAVGTVKGRVSAAEESRAGVVWVDGVSGEYPPPKQHALMDQQNLRFVPHVLPILVGTTVDFLNSDPLLHNVFSISRAKRFNLGLYPRGQAPSVTFDQPGVIAVLCNVHPEMAAYIVVLRTPFFALTSEDGSFSIHNVPAGEYILRCWLENGSTKQQRISVRAGGVETVAF
ncbi:MAG: hypothetical protein HYZ57_12215 [Acidobacteria bacterium]|nr:hypothetical protein [Acidobacteriota bacterium]MBI3280595.1 hypothetical protein [Acidobacteriota bacterium]